MIRAVAIGLFVVVASGFLLPRVLPWLSEQAMGGSGPTTTKQRIAARLQRGLAEYNQRLPRLASPEMTPQEARLSGQSVTFPFQYNGMIAPGSRNERALAPRRKTLPAVCREFASALRQGWRLTFVFSDLAGAQIRAAVAAEDCDRAS